MKGLVGFFDILGYQSFLENNSASESALDVLKIINDIPKKVKEIAESALVSDPGYVEICGAFKHMVFSDTIVFTLAYPEKADGDWIYAAHGYMATSSAFLAASMFESGLPIRGAIHEGDFITEEHCLAGKAVVDAYRLCESLNFSGLVLTTDLANKIIASQHDGITNNDSDFLFYYLSPMKDGSEKRLVHINWLRYLEDEHYIQFEKDAENYVLKSFWDHQKDCSKQVDEKVYNTAKVMRKMFHNFEAEKSKDAVASSSK